MELEKYYTPDIEEFYVGFEYEEWTEAHPEGMWNETTITQIADLEWPTDDLEHNGGNSHRVKYLDVDDIEDLDWDHLKHQSLGNLTWRFAIMDYNTRIEDDYSARYNNLYLMYFPDRHYVFIEADVETERETFFQGLIKNKSELRQEMKRLNIKLK